MYPVVKEAVEDFTGYFDILHTESLNGGGWRGAEGEGLKTNSINCGNQHSLNVGLKISKIPCNTL